MPSPVETRPRAHAFIASAALLWNLIGLVLFVMQARMSPAEIAALPPPDRAVFEATPGWLLALFGIAVVTGVLGSLALLFGLRWAAPAFAVSLGAIALQTVSSFIVTPNWQSYGPVSLILPIVLLTIGAALYRYAVRRGAVL